MCSNCDADYYPVAGSTHVFQCKGNHCKNSPIRLFGFENISKSDKLRQTVYQNATGLVEEAVYQKALKVVRSVGRDGFLMKKKDVQVGVLFVVNFFCLNFLKFVMACF